MSAEDRLRGAVDSSLLDLLEELDQFKRVRWPLLLTTSFVSVMVGIVIGRGF